MYHILKNTVTIRDIPTKIPTIVIIMVNFVLRNQPTKQKVKAKLFKICAAHSHNHSESLPSLNEEQ